MIPLEEKIHGRSKLRDGRFTVLCNALCIAIIDKIESSIRRLFVDTACFLLYYVHLVPVPRFVANRWKMIFTPLEIMVSKDKIWL